MSPRELLEWAAYERVAGPVGPARADVQAGIIASTVANVHTDKGRRFTPSDFVPRWDRRGQTVDEQLAVVRQLNIMFGGADET